MGGSVLGPYRVLDLTGENGFFAGKILGDMGADVIKVEPPGGDPARRRGPFWDDDPHPEKSLYWQAYNANKRGITLDWTTPTGRALFLRLVGKADFVLESYPPGYLAEHGVGYDALSGCNRAIILTSISPYGQEGPYSNRRAHDLEVIAASGFLSLLGSRDQAPVRIAEPQTCLWGGMNAAVASLVAHLYRRRSGEGQWVDVSMQASMVQAEAMAPIFWDVVQERTGREGSYLTGRNIHGARVCAIYPCRDGYVNFALYGGVAGRVSNRGLARWMQDADLAPPVIRETEWEQWNVVVADPEEIARIEAAVGDFLLTVTKREFFEAAMSYRILGYPVSDVRDLLADQQLASTELWQAVVVAGLGEVQLPGPFAEFSGATWPKVRPAPRIGEHNREVYGEMGLTLEEIRALRESGVL